MKRPYGQKGIRGLRGILGVVLIFGVLVGIGLIFGRAGGGIRPPVTAAEQMCAFRQTRIHLDDPFQRIVLGFGKLEIVDRTRRDFTVVARTAFGIPFAAVTVNDCPEGRLTSVSPTSKLMRRYGRSVEIFTAMRIEFTKAAGMPEHGYLPSHFLAYYPGLEPQDFDTAEAEGGTYHLEGDVLRFDPRAKGAALGTLSKFDMGRVFDAVRTRTDIDWNAERGTKAFMAAISAPNGHDEDLVLHDASGVRVSERPRASSRYRLENVEGVIEFRDILVDTGAGDVIVIPYQAYNVGLTSVRSVNEKNIVLAYGDGWWRTSEFWVIDRERKTVTRQETRPHFGQWLLVTPDGDIIYRTEDAIVLADPEWHLKKSVPFINGEDVVGAASLSEDGAWLALMTWNGAYEQDEARYVAHAVNLDTEQVITFGQVPESNTVAWDGRILLTGNGGGRSPALAPEDVTASFSVAADASR